MRSFRIIVFVLYLYYSFSYIIPTLQSKYTFVRHATQISDSTQYNVFDQTFFNLFAASVAKEMGNNTTAPKTFPELIKTISYMVDTNPTRKAHDFGKSILVRLFPPFILPLYKLSFAKFPSFSAWMNTWVTHFTTNWLMGNSTVMDLSLDNGIMAKEQLLVIEKCLFLEEAKCLKTCIHACKIPTQRFFLEEMGLPVLLRPNSTDYSCRFEFGIMPPILLKDDEISQVPCIDICPTKQDNNQRLLQALQQDLKQSISSSLSSCTSIDI